MKLLATKRHLGILFFFSIIAFSFFALFCSKSSPQKVLNSGVPLDGYVFELRSGDILVRPNWSWLPGSCDLFKGRVFGHVAIVTEGATGHTPDEALEKAKVIEAILFDQATRRFQFHKSDQLINRKALISFGPRFKGLRYRLRMNLTEIEVNAIRQFLVNQLQGGYNILSLKKHFGSKNDKEYALSHIKQNSWHCATLAWEAFYLVKDLDIDANQGLAIYPNDILASKYFDLPDGRIRF